MKIVLIGAGNLATQLGGALTAGGHDIVQVYSRTRPSAETLARRMGCGFTTDPNAVCTEADLYLLALKDSVLSSVARMLAGGRRQEAFFVHTAGSMPLELLHDAGALHYGVFYPMQTFSKERPVDFRTIPCFVEAGSAADTERLEQLAADLGAPCHRLDSERRRRLHLAAVFACNFTNHCYALAGRLVRESGLPFEVLLPLIDETARKVHLLSPEAAQTGPAVRYDENVLRAQRRLTAETDEAMAELYDRLSESIYRTAQSVLNQETETAND